MADMIKEEYNYSQRHFYSIYFTVYSITPTWCNRRAFTLLPRDLNPEDAAANNSQASRKFKM